MTYLTVKRTWTRWTTWEYLPMWVSNLPVAGFYLWYAAKARHLLFFSAANPAIPLGGAMGESKYDILQRLPDTIKPNMVFVISGKTFDQVLADIKTTHLTFPLIAKPDIGERGFLVKKIATPEELRQYLALYPVDFILQEWIDLPVEASVLYILFPGEPSRFEITSICLKEFLQITGNGKHRVRDLILQNPRAAFQFERIEKESPALMDKMLENGQVLPLGSIGNHCLGTKFLNANYLINQEMIKAYEPICRQIKGVFYGRFDLKCASLEALKNGQILVMELNGVLGEPAHVYDPTVGPWRAYRDFWRHWRLIFEVSEANRKLGVMAASRQEGLAQLRQYLAYKKQFALKSNQP